MHVRICLAASLVAVASPFFGSVTETQSMLNAE